MSGAEASATTTTTACPYGRHAAASAGPSPEGTAAAHYPARVRQGGAAVRRRAGRLSTLLAAHHRTGVAGPRASRHGTAHPASEVPPVVKTMDSFDFPSDPLAEQDSGAGTRAMRVPRPQGERPAPGQRWNWKNCIALALGLAACQRGHRVHFPAAAALVSELIEARDDKKLLRFQKQMASYELLIVDELGFVPLSKTGAELLFEMLSQRYERGSTLVTSNLPFQEWTEVLRLRAAGRRPTRSAHSSRSHPGDERRTSYRLKQSRRKRTHPRALRSTPQNAPRGRRPLPLRSRRPSTPHTQQLHIYLLAYFYSATVAWFCSALDRRRRFPKL